jgi:polyferredoxin
MATTENLQKQVDLIKDRNKRVEANKAWETSWTRRVLIFVLTYIVIVIFFYFAELPNPLTNAVVPAVAFLLSTLTLSYFKKLWLRRNSKL